MPWHAIWALCAYSGLAFAIESQRAHDVSVTKPPVSFQSTATTTSSKAPAASGSCPYASECCQSHTITASQDLAVLTPCSILSGDLVLQSFTATPVAQGAPPSISIPLVQITGGSLKVSGVSGAGSLGLTVSMDSLASVSGEISFTDIDNLEAPEFPSLAAVGAIDFHNVNFTASSTSFAGSSLYTSGTNVATLTTVGSIAFAGTNIKNIGPFSSSVNSTVVYILNNKQCESVNLAGVRNLHNALINNNQLTTLELSTLMSTTDPVEIVGNTGLINLNLSTLTYIGSSLKVVDNDQLTTVELSTISTVRGTVDLQGSFSNVSLPSSLDAVDGSIDIVSSGTLDCSPLSDIHALGHRVSCKHSSSVRPSPPSSSTSPPSTSAQSHGGSGLSTAAKIGIGVGVGVGGAVLIALALYLCIRLRRSRSRAPHGVAKEHEAYGGKADMYPYREVAFEAGDSKEMRQQQRSGEQTPNSLLGMGEQWVPPEPRLPTTEGRMELEEQQGLRHEMDARSIDFVDDDEEAETRSLEDIERVHRQ